MNYCRMLLLHYKLQEVGLACLISQLAWPFMYIFNTLFLHLNPKFMDLYMFIAGYFLLGLIVVITRKLFPGKDWVLYSSTVFAFTCVVDLIISLEVNGNVSGFMTQYLKYGEPYLNSSFGFAICLFDGIVYYAMYFIMIFAIANGKKYKCVGLYWCGAIICSSLLVEIYGFCMGGPHGPTMASLLNTPYIVVPIIALFRFFAEEKKNPSVQWSPNFSLSLRPRETKIVTSVLFFFTVLSMWSIVSLAYGSLGSDFWLFTWISKATPSINFRDPEPFSQIQVLIYLFYVCPMHIIFLANCFKPQKPQFLWNLLIVQAGIALQGQFTMIGISLYEVTTPAEYLSSPGSFAFWFSHLLILIVPHAQLYFLYKGHVDKGGENMSILQEDEERPSNRQESSA